MSQFLPTCGFKLIKEEDSPAEEDKTVEEFEDIIKKQQNEQNKGYFFF